MLCGNIWATGDEPDETKISTVAEVKAGAKGETFRVRGVCEEIANRDIGYWTLRDDTGYLYIVGTRSKEGDFNRGFYEWGIWEGDIVTVEGTKSNNRDFTELQDVSVINVEKPDFSISSVDPVNGYVSAQGGDVTVTLNNIKEYNVGVVYLIEVNEWISVGYREKGTNPVYIIRVAPNEGLSRSTTITFQPEVYSSEIPPRSMSLTITQGTSAWEVPVEDFLAAEPSDIVYGVTGILTAMKCDPEDQNQTYDFELTDFSGKLIAKTNLSADDINSKDINVGDIVSLVGKRVKNGNADYMDVSLASLKNKVQEISIADFDRYGRNQPDIYYKITGVVGEEKYGTQSYYFIHDEQDNRLYVDECKSGYGDWDYHDFIKKSGIEVGDQLTILRNQYEGWRREIFRDTIYLSHVKGAKKYTAEDIVAIVNMITGGGYSAEYDVNGDEKVDIADIIIVVNKIVEDGNNSN